MWGVMSLPNPSPMPYSLVEGRGLSRKVCLLAAALLQSDSFEQAVVSQLSTREYGRW